MRLVLLAGPGNSVGRTYCLWLLAQELGWSSTPVVADEWLPLANTDFSRQCARYEDIPDLVDQGYDAMIAYQPLPETLGVALAHAGDIGAPVLVDIDELAWEQRYGYSHRHQMRVAAAMLFRGRNPWPYQWLRFAATHRSILLSNPSLRRYYPGTIIPHVRSPRPLAPLPDGDRLEVAFVGTVRAAKGLDQLRSAVAAVDGVHLTVTASAPPDATTSETWTGSMPFSEGLQLLDRTHAVAVMSHDTEWTRHQFPVKLIDGMLAGRAIIASDLPPIRWALGDTAILVPPDDRRRLVAALRHLRDHTSEARQLGVAARQRALELFSPAQVAPAFEHAIRGAQ